MTKVTMNGAQNFSWISVGGSRTAGAVLLSALAAVALVGALTLAGKCGLNKHISTRGALMTEASVASIILVALAIKIAQKRDQKAVASGQEQQTQPQPQTQNPQSSASQMTDSLQPPIEKVQEQYKASFTSQGAEIPKLKRVDACMNLAALGQESTKGFDEFEGLTVEDNSFSKAEEKPQLKASLKPLNTFDPNEPPAFTETVRCDAPEEPTEPSEYGRGLPEQDLSEWY